MGIFTAVPKRGEWYTPERMVTESLELPEKKVYLASRKRRLLAIYLDYLFFSSIWGVVLYGLLKWYEFALPGVTKIPVFILVEMFAYGYSFSIGFAFLSIYRVALSQGSESQNPEIALIVDPKIKVNESWFSMLVAFLLFLDGSKAVYRWTLGNPALPLWDAMTPFVNVCVGLLYFLIAYHLFKLRKRGTRLAIVWMTVWIGYVCLLWNKWDDWVTQTMLLRAERRGRPLQSIEDIEPILRFVPEALVAGGVFVIAILIVLHRKMRYV